MNLHDSNLTSKPGERDDSEVEEAFERLMVQGQERLARPLVPLVATGLLGGIDVAVGVLIYLVVLTETGSSLVAALAFTIGFVALLLASSELFTENFLVPVTAVLAGKSSVAALLRLWVVSLATNLVSGLAMAAMIIVALPAVEDSAITTGAHYADLGVSVRSFFLAVLAGAVITLLTRMQNSTESLGVKIVPAVLMSFVLVGAELFHSVLDSIFMFAGLLTGRAPYGWTQWLGALGWSALGNILGGVVLVTAIRVLRVPHRIVEERQKA